MDRAGRWVREAPHGGVPEQPTSQEPRTQFFDLFDESVPERGGTRPDRLVDVRPQEWLQRRTVEQLVDAVPCLPALDAPVPLVVEQLVTVLAEMEREEDAAMNWLEDRILQGAPVSAAEKAPWRRCAPGGGEASSRRRKKRKKKKLPRGGARLAARVPAVREGEGAADPVPRQSAGCSSCDSEVYPQCNTVQKTGRLHRSRGAADVHAATSSSSSSFLIPCRIPSIPHAQFLDKVVLPVVVQDWFSVLDVRRKLWTSHSCSS